MKIIADSISMPELKEMAGNFFGTMVKAVVDVEKELLAVDAELHADLEAHLLDEGSEQKNLWGINLYPEFAADKFIGFESMINLRPSQGNKTRGVDDPKVRERIMDIVSKRIQK